MKNLNESKYKADIKRLLNLWIFPVIFGLFVCLIFLTRLINYKELSIPELLTFVFLISFSVGVFIVLFFNHLPLARETEFTITGKQLIIRQFGNTECLQFSEITSIEEYSTAKLPWSSLMFWKITAKNKEFTVSSLTISKSNFDRYFWNKIEQKTSVLPLL